MAMDMVKPKRSGGSFRIPQKQIQCKTLNELQGFCFFGSYVKFVL